MSGLTTDKLSRVPGAYSEICPGGAYIFFFPGGGAQQPLGHENPLKSIDFTGPGGLSPNIPPPEFASAGFPFLNMLKYNGVKSKCAWDWGRVGGGGGGSSYCSSMQTDHKYNVSCFCYLAYI